MVSCSLYFLFTVVCYYIHRNIVNTFRSFCNSYFCLSFLVLRMCTAPLNISVVAEWAAPSKQSFVLATYSLSRVDMQGLL